MNQKQRAGKHPRFSRDRKPLGLTREKYQKTPGLTREKYHKTPDLTREKYHGTHVLTRDKYEWECTKYFLTQITPTTNFRKTGQRLVHKRRGWGKSHGSSVSDLTELTTSDASRIRNVAAEISYFYLPELCACLVGNCKQIQENVFHLLMIVGMTDDNYGFISRLLSKVKNRKHVMCMLSVAASKLSRQRFLLLVQTAYHTTQDDSLKLCLHEALCHKRWDLVTKLLTVWRPSKTDISIVFKAALRSEQWELVADCVRRDVNQKLMNLTLVKAIQARQWKILETCISRAGDLAAACSKHKVDLNALTSHHSGTVLHDAVGQCSLKVMELMLKAGCDPDIRDRHRITVIHMVFLNLHSNYAQFELHRSSPYHVLSPVTWDLISLFIAHSKSAGLMASEVMENGKTMLHTVCTEGKVDILRTLLLKNANPLVTDENGQTLMMAALRAKMGNENLLRVLIQSGVATHQAVTSKALLTKCRSLPETDRYRLSPMGLAVFEGRLRLAKLLCASGACSNSEIYELSSSSVIRSRQEQSWRHDILKYLDEISSQPRSLRDLCAFQVSHLIGSGAGRSERLARSGLPPMLCSHVMHDHVVSLDFLRDTPCMRETVFRDDYLVNVFHDRIPYRDSFLERQQTTRWNLLRMQLELFSLPRKMRSLESLEGLSGNCHCIVTRHL